MLTLGPLTFLTPAALLALAALPILWLLLRLTPPALRRVDFPAVRLLFNLPKTERTSARTPPWLIALRLILMGLALIGLANPLLRAERSRTDMPLAIVLDNGWAAAEQWNERQDALRSLLERAARHDREAVLITTAPVATATARPQLAPAREVLAQAGSVQPQPWPTHRKKAAAQLRALGLNRESEVVWISDGIATPEDSDLSAALSEFSQATAIVGESAALILLPPRRVADDNTRIGLKLRRVVHGDAAPATLAVRALDRDGHVVARSTVDMSRDARSAEVFLNAPPELSNRIARFDVENHAGAAATVLAGSRWQQRPVGIADANTSGISAPFLADAFYIRQALAPTAEIREGSLDTLLSHPLAVIFLAGGRVLDAELDRLTSWVEQGGILVRFAGQRLDGNVDPLLPVRLRSGGRSFGGTLSWSQPARLAPFSDTSPFKTMVVPDDVAVAKQVLAEPSPDLPGKTWARLNDGTPLVTAARRGQGWVILFHVSATPEWSSLPLSGLFVNMLQRVVDLSAGVAVGTGEEATGTRAPLQLLDGFGTPVSPGPTARPILAKSMATGTAGPDLPPGLYGMPANAVAFNLSPQLMNVTAIRSWPANVHRVNLRNVTQERPLKPYFLIAALVLLLADLAVSLAVRGLAAPVWRRSPLVRVVLVCATLVAAGTWTDVNAGETQRRRAVDPATSAAILETRLAYVETGDAVVDLISAQGLRALTRVLAARTSAEMADPAGVKLAVSGLTADMLAPYPLIYWRISSTQEPPNPRTAAAISMYLRRGGMLLLDAPAQTGAIGGEDALARLDAILGTLDLPPLRTMEKGHVLTRSFYLLQGLPGRFTDSAIYVNKGDAATDGVSSVIIGGNDWAAAWARDNNGLPLYPVVPGGERQREMAYRAGVNMVMYALTGNYKSDQVHLPAIMQRLTQ